MFWYDYINYSSIYSVLHLHELKRNLTFIFNDHQCHIVDTTAAMTTSTINSCDSILIVFILIRTTIGV